MKKVAIITLISIALIHFQLPAAQWNNDQFSALKASNNKEALAAFTSIIFAMAQMALIQDYDSLVEDKIIESHPLVSGAREVGVWGEKAQELGNKSFEILAPAIFEKYAQVAQAGEALSDTLSEIESPTDRLKVLESVYQEVLTTLGDKAPQNWPNTLYPEAEDESNFEAEADEETIAQQSGAGTAETTAPAPGNAPSLGHGGTHPAAAA